MDISAAEFYSRYHTDKTFKIIDVRERIEFQTFNMGGDNIPLGILIKEVDELDYQKEDEIVVICQRGLRSETARRILTQNGYINVRNLTGGILAIQKLKNIEKLG